MSERWLAKYKQHIEHYNAAVDHFEHAERLMAHGLNLAARKRVADMYLELLDAEDAIWERPATAKQTAQRRLWLERGQLELILSAVKRYKYLLANSIYDHAHWRDGPTENIVKAMINENHKRMKELSSSKNEQEQV